MWLLRRLAPDFKTIADFRRDNGTAIVGTCRAFVLFCRDQGLFTARLVALDGSKFRAAASTKRVMGRREIAEEAVRLDRRIAEYLAGLDESDAREPDEAPNATAAALQVLEITTRWNSIGWPPSSMPRSAPRWWMASSMPDRWGSASAGSRAAILQCAKRPSMPTPASSSTTR